MVLDTVNILQERHLDRRQAAVAGRSLTAIYLGMLQLAPANGGPFHASQAMIADRAGVTRRVVRKWLPLLVSNGIVIKAEKHAAIPLANGQWRRYATVWEMPRVANHSYLHTERTTIDVFESEKECNLSKSHGDFDEFDTSIQDTESDNTEDQDFFTFFVESDRRWKGRRRSREETKREEEQRGRALWQKLQRVSAWGEVTADDFPDWWDETEPWVELLQPPQELRRDAYGKIYRLRLNRSGMQVFWSRKTKGRWQNQFFFVLGHEEEIKREEEQRRREEEEQRLREEAAAREYERRERELQRQRERLWQMKRAKERKAREERQRIEAAQYARAREKDREYFRKIARGEISVDFEINEKALAAALG